MMSHQDVDAETPKRSSPMDDRVELLRSLTIYRPEQSLSQSPVAGKYWKVWGTVAVILLIVNIAAWSVLLRDQNQDSALSVEPPQTTQSLSSVPIPYQEPERAGGLIASGYVVARRRATIAAEVTGKIVDVLVEEGMVVHKGQILARLDGVLSKKDLELAQLRVEAAWAAYEASAAEVRDAKRFLNRTKTLFQSNVASKANLTKAEERTYALQAKLHQSEVQFEVAKLEAERASAALDKLQIRAPFDGVVVERSAQPGEMISPLSAGGFTRTGICTIVDMDSIEIEVDVSEAYIGRLDKGVNVTAILDAYPDWTIPGSVIAIVPTANRVKATVTVRIGFQQKDPRILPDMAAKVTFIDEVIGSALPYVTSAN